MFKTNVFRLIFIFISLFFIVGCSSSDDADDTQNNTQPTSENSQNNTQPTSDNSQNNTQPTSDNSQDNNQPSSAGLNILSPQKSQNIEYSYVTLEIDATGLQSVTAQNVTTDSSNFQNIKGVKNNNIFYVYNVPLIEGANQIDITSVKDDGSTMTSKLSLTSQAQGIAVYVDMDQREGYEKLSTGITVKTLADASEYLLDEDGNGVFDQNQTINTFAVNYNEQGQFIPRATIRTNDNVLFSSINALPVNIKAQLTETVIAGISEQVVDIERFGDFIYALAGSNIYKLDKINNAITDTISLTGVSEPMGFCYDKEENLYIADTGNNRVIKLLKSSGYQGDSLISFDGSFGILGSDDGQFNQPTDCMVDSSANDEKIFVVDSGNNRIQVFNRAGVFISKFDGSDTATGKFNNPQGIVASSIVPIIADTDNNLIRFFYQNGKEKRVFGDNVLNTPTKINSSDKRLLIADTGNKRILITTTHGDIIKVIEISDHPSVAINYISDRDITLVSYQGQTGMTQLATDADTVNSTPQKVVEKFVHAILADDRKTVEDMVASEKIIDRIYSDADMYNVLIEHLNIVKEYQLTSKDKLFAGVTITFNGTDDTLPVMLVKQNDQWFINQF